MKRIIGTLVIAIIGGIISLGLFKIIERNYTSAHRISVQESLPVQLAGYNPLPDGGLPDFTKAAEMTIHAVVHIKTEYQQKSSVYDDFFGLNDPIYQFFWGNRNTPAYKPQPIIGFGSGVILSPDGYIVTNNHVVQDADFVEVTLNDKRTFSAKVIGTDPATDLALIKIEGTDLSFIPYGNSDSAKVGEWVLAVGNPFNLTSTVTAGIISAKARNINILNTESAIESYIQTDAAVNKGNSGGALVNTKGQLIGINAAIASNTGSYTGYSFAIPINIVKKVVDDLLKFGEVQRAYLGINYAEMDSKLAQDKGIDLIEGLYIMSVVPNGAAEDAGLRSGDIIIKIGSNRVRNSSELKENIGRLSPGDKINITINRSGIEKDFQLVLKNQAGTTTIAKADDIKKPISILGATFKNISQDEMRQLGLSYGLKITNLMSGKLRNAGIREGFIITSIDKKPIKNIDDINQALNDKKGGVLIEGIYPNGMRAYYGFGL